MLREIIRKFDNIYSKITQLDDGDHSSIELNDTYLFIFIYFYLLTIIKS